MGILRNRLFILWALALLLTGCFDTNSGSGVSTDNSEQTGSLRQPSRAVSVSGAIGADTVWTAANSPYLVSSNILVQQGTTLTIEPGVEVRLAEGRSIQVDGQLIARGTADNRIKFTPDVPGTYWAYLSFEDSSVDATFDASGYVSGSILEFVDLEYGGNSNVLDKPTVRAVYSSRPYLKDVSIKHGLGDGLYMYSPGFAVILDGVDASNNAQRGAYITGEDSVRIDRSRFSSNGTDGLTTGSGTGSITNSVFDGNGYIALNICGLSPSSLVVDNNRITNNYHGVSVLNTFCYPYLTHNIIARNRYGTYLSQGTFNQNVYADNSYEFSANGGSNNNVFADNVVEESGNGIVARLWGSRNSFVRNRSSGQNAIDIYYGALTDSTFAYNTLRDPGLGLNVAVARSYSTDSTITGSNFIGNQADYLLNNGNSQGTTINGTSNWWGSANDADVQAAIYDYFDDANVGVVTYAPFLTTINTAAPISPPASVTTTVSPGQIALSWPANPEADVAGYKVYWGKEDAPFYSNVIDVGNVTSYTLTGLTEGAWFVGVTAYDTSYSAAADLTTTIVNDMQIAGNESWFTRVTANPLEASALSVAYGNVYTGFSAAQTITITNKGYSVYDITNVYLSGAHALEYAITSDSCGNASIAAGASCTVTVAFNPKSSGVKDATLSVTPADANHLAVNVALQGTGVDTGDISAATTLGYGTVVLGGSTTQSLRIDNSGTGTLSMASALLSGADATDFAVTNSCTSIGAGSYCDLSIKFSPTTTGSKSVTLTLTSDDPDEPSTEVALSGLATAQLTIGHLSVDNATGYAPLAVNFAVTVSGGSGVYDYSWNFGDGTSNTTQSPSHSYSSTGVYTASVTITDRNDPQNSVSGSLQIGVGSSMQQVPVGISALGVDVASAVVPFTAQFSVTPSGGSGSYSYAWSFGDGTTSTVNNPSHSYTTAGSYTVSVTVTDSVNPSLTTTGNLQVLAIAAPVAYSPLSIGQLSANQVAGVAPLAVSFSVSGTGASGSYSYAWNFGDGSTGSGAAPSHSYTAAGTYQVAVVVTDQQDTTVSTTGNLVVVVTEQPSVIQISQLSASKVAGVAPMVVDFSVAASGGSGVYSYTWNFGDGSTGTGATPNHSYANAGAYQVSVVIQDQQDASVTGTGEMVILVAAQPVAYSPIGITQLGASQVAGVAPMAVNFTVAGSGGSGQYTYTWSFGDGTTGTGATPSHTYANAGTYQVSVVVKDASDATLSTSGQLTIVIVDTPSTISVGLTANQTSGTAPFATTFSATINGGTAPYSVTWNFGDGMSETQSVTGTTTSISHTYSQAGYYEVSLVVTSSSGAGSTASPVNAAVGLNVSAPAASSSSSGGGGGGALDYLMLLALAGVVFVRRRGEQVSRARLGC